MANGSDDLVFVFQRSVDKTLSLIEGQIRLLKTRKMEAKVRACLTRPGLRTTLTYGRPSFSRGGMLGGEERRTARQGDCLPCIPANISRSVCASSPGSGMSSWKGGTTGTCDTCRVVRS